MRLRLSPDHKKGYSKHDSGPDEQGNGEKIGFGYVDGHFALFHNTMFERFNNNVAKVSNFAQHPTLVVTLSSWRFPARYRHRE
jgi:hypothetical protein